MFNSPYRSKTGLFLGRHNDDPKAVTPLRDGIGEEVYSGGLDDDTIERILLYNWGSERNATKTRWSIMSSGYEYPFRIYPPNSSYEYGLRFSVEELLTVETNNAVSEAH